METRDVTIENAFGVHLRVATEIVAIATKHDATVHLTCGKCRRKCRTADGCSVLELLLLDAGHGAKVRLQVEGPDEKIVADRLCLLFADGGGI